MRPLRCGAMAIDAELPLYGGILNCCQSTTCDAATDIEHSGAKKKTRHRQRSGVLQHWIERMDCVE